MKNILLLTLVFILCASSAFAAQPVPAGYPPALEGMDTPKSIPEIPSLLRNEYS